MKQSEGPVLNIVEKKEEEQRLVLLALLPAVVAGLIRFRMDAFLVLLVSIGTGVIFDFIYHMIRKKEKEEKFHFHAGNLIICMLLGLILPPGLPWYCVAAGSMFALLVGKYAFVQDGCYFLNPVLAAKAFLLLTFAGPMGKVMYQGKVLETPLESLMAGEGVNTMKLFLGNTAGSIGTISMLAILLGAIFLLWFDVIQAEAPIGILIGFLAVAAFVGIPAAGMSSFHYMVAECCSGGFLFGAFFLATEPRLLPKGHGKQLIYGLFIGVVAACLRFFADSKEGITYAILAGNLLLPLANRVQRIKERIQEKRRGQIEEKEEADAEGRDGQDAGTSERDGQEADTGERDGQDAGTGGRDGQEAGADEGDNRGTSADGGA